MDDDSGAVFREAARNMFFMSRFEEAQSMIDRAFQSERVTQKDGIVLNDLQAQLFIRRAEQSARIGNYEFALSDLAKLRDFVTSLSVMYVDATLVQHVVKVQVVIDMLGGRVFAQYNRDADDYYDWLEAFEHTYSRCLDVR